MDDTQLDMSFPIDADILKTFLVQYAAIHDEQDRLREELRLLTEEFKDQLPMRAIRTAEKIIRARRKLAEHAKEPMSYALQGAIEAQVGAALIALEAEKQRMVPDMVGAG